MKNIRLAIILSVIIVTASTRADSNEVPSAMERGTEIRLEVDTEPNEILIYVPTDYNDITDWPVIFYYYGQGEVLSTERFQKTTQGKGFIIVSMEFAPTPQGAITLARYRN